MINQAVCICCTLRRPHLLANMLACFFMQDYPLKRLFILDDDPNNKEVGKFQMPLVTYYKTQQKFPSLGAKHNAAIRMAHPLPSDLIVIMDDDDIYLPWHISTHVEAIEASNMAWSRPQWVMSNYVRRASQGAKPYELKHAARKYHGSWAYMMWRYTEALGYPEEQPEANHFDTVFGRRLSGMYKWWYQGPIIDQSQYMPLEHEAPNRISYCYRWLGGNWSGIDEKARDETILTKRPVTTEVNPFDLRPLMDQETIEFYEREAPKIHIPQGFKP